LWVIFLKKKRKSTNGGKKLWDTRRTKKTRGMGKVLCSPYVSFSVQHIKSVRRRRRRRRRRGEKEWSQQPNGKLVTPRQSSPVQCIRKYWWCPHFAAFISICIQRPPACLLLPWLPPCHYKEWYNFLSLSLSLSFSFVVLHKKN
jgi:hypothetical protein